MRLTTISVAALAALIAFAATPTPLAAQDATETWGLEATLSLNASGGNEELTVLTSEAEISHIETSAYEATLGGRFRYGQTDGEKVAQNLRGDASVDIWPEGRWSPFFFGSGENDPFKKLELRFNGGGGLKRTLWQDEWDELSVSGAVLYSYENLEVADSLGDGVSQTARWSWRTRGRLEFGEGRRFEQVVFFQPAWNRLDDYLLESRTSARWALTRSLAFTTAFTYARDSTPAPEVEADDWALSVGLTAITRW